MGTAPVLTPSFFPFPSLFPPPTVEPNHHQHFPSEGSDGGENSIDLTNPTFYDDLSSYEGVDHNDEEEYYYDNHIPDVTEPSVNDYGTGGGGG